MSHYYKERARADVIFQAHNEANRRRIDADEFSSYDYDFLPTSQARDVLERSIFLVDLNFRHVEYFVQINDQIGEQCIRNHAQDDAEQLVEHIEKARQLGVPITHYLAPYVWRDLYV